MRDPAWLIYFDDKDIPPEVFTGPGADAAASSRLISLEQSWSVTLFYAPEGPKSSAEQASAGQPVVIRCNRCKGTVIYKRVDGEFHVIHGCESAQLSTTREQLEATKRAIDVVIKTNGEQFKKLEDTREIARELAAALEFLVDQLDRSNAVDDHGHAISNLHALTVSRSRLAKARAAGLLDAPADPTERKS